MPQFERPSADTFRGNWTKQDGGTSSIFTAIDEASADDADYIQSPLTPVSEVYVAKLSGVEDPLVSSGHTLRYRHRKEATGGDIITLTVQLRQGYVNESSQGTLIVQRVESSIPGSGWVTGEFHLSGAEIDAITNYADLYLRFVAST